MATGQNFFYQGNPGAEIGASLATALFGDPERAAKQRDMQAQAALRDAQMREANAHGGLYTEQTRGVRGQNDASDRMPTLASALFTAPPAPPQPSLSDPNFAADAGPSEAYHVPSQEDVLRANLPAFIANIGQMQGDKIDPRQIMGTLASFMGGDELARRGLVAQGHTPEANFALTPQRADAISARDAGEEQTQAWGTARINHQTDIPVANIQASAKRYGDDRQLEGTKYTAFTEAEARRAAAAAKADRTVGTHPHIVSAAASDKLKKLIEDFADAHRVSITGQNKANILSNAITLYQQTGNMYDAVNQATARLAVNGQRVADRDENGEGPPVPGARQAADGKWYVQTGANANGTPAYSVVESPASKRWLPWAIGW